jgi:UDP-2,3-diacylglucosamine pyrophosphatase LpxH
MPKFDASRLTHHASIHFCLRVLRGNPEGVYMQGTAYVISDVHLGPGKLNGSERWDPLEDFTVDEQLCAFIAYLARRRDPVELIIAGDFLEYCQILPQIGFASPVDHLGSSETESLERTAVLLGKHPNGGQGHPEVFVSLRHFMAEGHSLTLIAGNHDIDILWDEVWAQLFDAIYPPGSSGTLRRVPFSYVLGTGKRGRVYIEHGHEHDRANRIGDQMAFPFDFDPFGVQRLKRCWGTLFVDKVYNELEAERWFIDNVKPSLRALQLGMRHDFPFTATAVALVARFLLTSGLPPILGGSEVVLGTADAPPKAEEFISALADKELRDYLDRQLDDPIFRTEFEASMRGMTVAEWEMVQSGAAQQASLDELTAAPVDDLILGGSGVSEDTYVQAARTILERDERIGSVIFGHTHTPIAGQIIEIDAARGGRYFNSGTWTPHLREAHRNYSWDEIADERNYVSEFTYVELHLDSEGGYDVALHYWQG